MHHVLRLTKGESKNNLPNFFGFTREKSQSSGGCYFWTDPKLIALLGVLAMGGILIYAFTVGDFAAEGSQLTSMPWGIVSLVDLYVGFALFAGWIIYREQSPLHAAVWVVLLMVLGFFIGSLCPLVALFTSQGNWTRFWQGQKEGQKEIKDEKSRT